MEKILLNQMEVNGNRTLKTIQKQSMKKYRFGKKGVKPRIGKLVESGMTGMSGNGFPVINKLMTMKKINAPKTLIINGMECEPGLLHDEWLINNKMDEILTGIEILNQLIPFERCILAKKEIRGNKLQKKQDLKKQKNSRMDVNVFVEHIDVQGNYPMGEEHLLIRQVIGTRLEKNEIPAEHGILVMNVQTIYQIYCLATDQYRNGKYVTLANLNTGKAKVVFALKEETIWKKMKDCFPEEDIKSCYAGGGIMSAEAVDKDIDFHDRITFAAIGPIQKVKVESKCKGCGNCNRNCPMEIPIKQIIKHIEKQSEKQVQMECIIQNQNSSQNCSAYSDICLQCGSCSFFCKAGKNIPQYIKGGN